MRYDVRFIAQIYLTYEVDADSAAEAERKAKAEFYANEEPAKAEDYGDLVRVDQVVRL
jgi:hypothetical protein